MRMSGNKIILKSSLVINRTPRKNMENHRFWIYTPSFGNDSMKTVAFIETRSLLPKSSRVKLCQIIQVNVTHTNVWIHQGWSFKTRLQLLPHHANQKNHWSNSIDVRLFLKKTSFFTLCIVRTSPYFRVSGASRWNNDPALYTNTLYIYNQLVSQRCECVCVFSLATLFFAKMCNSISTLERFSTEFLSCQGPEPSWDHSLRPHCLWGPMARCFFRVTVFLG